MKKMLLVALRLVLGGCALGGCATFPAAHGGNACGDPCANLACPSAFVCTVDAHCAARCQPEPVKPGMP
jgi:hypothetical protein